ELIQFNTCRPSTRLTKSADKTDVTVGDSVTYTYTEENDGQVALTNPFVTDDKCSPVSYSSGDSNNNGVLDKGETWTYTCTHNNGKLDPGEVFTFTCSKIYLGPGTFTNVAVGHGIDNLGRDVTFCAPGNSTSGKFCDARETDTKTVSVTVSVTGGK